MSRSTRPLRRVGAVEREALALSVLGGRSARFMQALRVWPVDMSAGWVRQIAAVLRCRPAQLRRCLLGRPVSARAAGRILAS